MARAPTTSDVFNAVAEPQRREILNLLRGGERSVNDIVGALGFTQPQVSKHLRVLREVGLVNVRSEGQQRWYRLNAERLRPIHDWVKSYEQFWNEAFDKLDLYLKELQQKEKKDDGARNDEATNSER